MIGIYKITNLLNGKFYIGQSVDIKRRFYEHKKLNREVRSNIKKAIKKYGLENFYFEVLEECSPEMLNEKEIFYIKTLKPEYNICEGGTGLKGYKLDEKTIQKIKIKNKLNWENKSFEEKNKIIKNNLTGPKKNHKVSLKTREKLRLHNLNKKQSIEAIEKRKKTIENKKKNGYVQLNLSHKKQVLCIETKQIFNSIKEASEILKINSSSISLVAKGKRKSCGGYRFKYL